MGDRDAHAGVAHADDDRIVAHLKKQLGGYGWVFHELVSERVHVDVHVMPPTKKREHIVLVTSGMSALPMTVIDSIDDPESFRYAELCVLLPRSWNLDHGSFSDERNYWPIRLLKSLARLPHDHDTFLAGGHSIPNGVPAEPYARGLSLTGAVLAPPLLLGPKFFTVPGTPPMRIYQVIPLTTAEMELKLEQGFEALLERLETLPDPGVFGPIDPKRKSVA